MAIIANRLLARLSTLALASPSEVAATWLSSCFETIFAPSCSRWRCTSYNIFIILIICLIYRRYMAAVCLINLAGILGLGHSEWLSVVLWAVTLVLIVYSLLAIEQSILRIFIHYTIFGFNVMLNILLHAHDVLFVHGGTLLNQF
jgi:hypothetical protein